MKIMRLVFLLCLIGCIGGGIFLLVIGEYEIPFKRTFSPLFQVLGKPLKSVDRAISKVVPVSDVDEKMLGEEIKKNLSKFHFPKDAFIMQQTYLDGLVKNLTSNKRKNFDYCVYLFKGAPNAYALPGGIICITNELLDIVTNEAELVGILSHEIGHIEMGHLFDAVRGEMLRKKIKTIAPLAYALETIQFFSHFSFSKTQENEADEYAFRMLLEKGYHPLSLSTAFQKILNDSPKTQGKTHILEEFFSTHPYTEIRRDKFRSWAEKWLHTHPDVKMYVGKRNLDEKKSRYEISYLQEFE